MALKGGRMPSTQIRQIYRKLGLSPVLATSEVKKNFVVKEGEGRVAWTH